MVSFCQLTMGGTGRDESRLLIRDLVTIMKQVSKESLFLFKGL